MKKYNVKIEIVTAMYLNKSTHINKVLTLYYVE